MSGRQFVVVGFPFSDLQVEAVGPFRSPEKAAEAVRVIAEAWDASGMDYGMVPHVVELSTVKDFIDTYIPI